MMNIYGSRTKKNFLKIFVITVVLYSKKKEITLHIGTDLKNLRHSRIRKFEIVCQGGIALTIQS